MHAIMQLWERHYKEKNWNNYDGIFQRLCVTDEDAWCGIESSTVSPDYNPEPPIFAAKFASANNYQHILALANEDGKIAFQNTERGAPREAPVGKPLKGEQCHNNAVFDLEWMPFDTKLVSASGDNTARLWAFTESSLHQLMVFQGHSRSLKTVAFGGDDPSVFSTGGRDGIIFVWDVRAATQVNCIPRPDKTIFQCHAGSALPTNNQLPSTSLRRNQLRRFCRGDIVRNCGITGLVFQNKYDLISCGAGDGIIKVWDLRKSYSFSKREPVPKYTITYNGGSTCKGFTNLLLDTNKVKLFANCMDNNIYCYNVGTYSPDPIQIYTGHENASFYIKSSLSPDERYLVSGSSNERAYIWNCKHSTPLVALEGHSAEVTCAVWCQKDDIKIVTCSDDAKHKVWRIGNEHINDCDKLEFRGHAKVIKEYSANIKTIRNHCATVSLETTPRSVKLLTNRNDRTPSSERSTRSRLGCDYCRNTTPPYDNSSIKCSKCNSENRALKRSSQMSSPVLDNNECETKRMNLDKGARRLFSPLLENRIQPSTSNAPQLATIIERLEDIDQDNDDIDDHNSVTNHKGPTTPIFKRDLNLPKTPHNRLNKLEYTSPTVNLPNFILDGEAPHLQSVSPKKKCKVNEDWLTRIRKQKCLVYESELVRQLSPHATNMTHGTPQRRNRSRSSTDSIHKTPTSRKTSKEKTLLQFFTVTRSNKKISNV